MDRFLKRTEHPVSPVLPAPEKPKVSSKQGVISALFSYKSCNLVIDHHREFVIKRHIDSKV